MPTFKDTVMIKDRSFDRAVQVVIIAPEGVSALNVQELAQRAWRAVGNTITVDGVTVKVRAFGR